MWGHVPVYALVAATSLVVAAAAHRFSLQGEAVANVAFWIGLLVLFVPIAVRTSMSGVSRHETVALVALLAIALYLIKVLHSPNEFTFHDEFLHWRTADDIMRTGRLFTDNPLLPASAQYPALEIITVALVQVGGMSIFHAGLVVVAIARVALALALFLSFERLTRSTRIAGFAVVVYMTNSNFIFLNASFKYETIALTFVALAMYLTIQWARYQRALFAVTAIVAGMVTAMSHHLSAVALVVLIGAWSVGTSAAHRIIPGLRWRAPWPVFLAVGAAAAGWILVVAPVTVGYLAPVFEGAMAQGLEFITSRLGLSPGTDIGRPILPSASSDDAWERWVALAAVAAVSVSILVGAWLVLRRYWRTPFLLLFLLALPIYPASLLLRLTPAGWETANRSSEFLYIALAVPLAIGILWLSARFSSRRARLAVVAILSALMIFGGIRSGWRSEDRLAGPYVCCNVPAALDAEGVEAARWARDVLPADSRVGAERVNSLLFGSYGGVWTMSTLSGGINPNWVLFSETFDDDKLRLLGQGRVEYLVVDRRVVTDPDAFREYLGNQSMSRALAKYEAADLDRVFDSGALRIYRVETLWQ